MTSEEDFQEALDREPDNHLVRLIFADFLQERGDVRAEGYRALGANEKCPASYCLIRGTVWTFWRYDRIKEIGHLGEDWWALVEGESIDGYSNAKDYRSRRECEDAAALAFPKLPEKRQTELLKGEAVSV